MALPVQQIWRSAVEAGRPVSRTGNGESPIARTFKHLLAENTNKQAVDDFEGLLGRLAMAEANRKTDR